MSTYVLWASQSNSGDARDLDKRQLRDQLAGLLLIARVDHSLTASGGSFAGFQLGIIVRFILSSDVLRLWDLVVRQFFDTWVRHFGVLSRFATLADNSENTGSNHCLTQRETMGTLEVHANKSESSCKQAHDQSCKRLGKRNVFKSSTRLERLAAAP